MALMRIQTSIIKFDNIPLDPIKLRDFRKLTEKWTSSNNISMLILMIGLKLNIIFISR